MKNLLFILLIFLLASCGHIKRYDVHVQYFNGQIDTILIYSERTPELTEVGAITYTTDPVFPNSDIEVAGVRKMHVIKETPLK